MTKEEDTLDTGRLGDIQKRLGKSLPNDWVLTTLGEAFKWGSGGTPKRTDTRFYGGNIPWLIIGDLNDGVVTDSQTTITEEGLKESSTKWVEPGSILLAMYGSIGKLGIAGRRLTTNQAIAFTKPDPVDAKYLFYYLMYTRGDLASLGKGATQKNISQTVIKAFPFVLAPQGQQKRIVAEIEKQFSRLDEAVATLKRDKANLKRYKAAALKAAVEGRLVEGRLVETEAELARREGRSYENGEQLLQRILETRRSQWKGKGKYKEPAAPDTTDLPDLPEGWCWLCVETIAFVTKLAGFEYTKFVKYSPDGDLAVIKAENAGPSGFKRTEFSRINSNTVSKLTRSQLKPGDILMVFVGAGTGYVARVPDDQPYFLGPNIAMIRIESSEISIPYIEMFLRSPIGNSLALAFAKAVAQPSLSMGSIRMIPIAIPVLSEQQRIVTEVDRRLSLVREVETQVDANMKRAERLRQSILSKAYAGLLVQHVLPSIAMAVK